MKRLVARVCAGILVFASSFAGFSSISIAADSTKLSRVGQQAFSDITTCLTSGKEKALDVFYLIDNSGSLSYTDVEEVRTEVLANSLTELANFSDQGIEVSYAAALFNSDVEPIQNWTKLTDASQAKQISKSVNNQRLGDWTDWEEGLRFAKNQLESRGNSCRMLIWFTDGGINPDGEIPSTFKSLSNLCRTGITQSSLGTSENYGLMAEMRKSQISIFGVLYQDDKSSLDHYTNQLKEPDPQARLDFEHYLMSFMVPLIEGKGTISEKAKDYPTPGGELQCGEVTESGFAPAGEPNGAFLNAEDPVSLAFQFLKLESQITGGSGVPIIDGKFSIKPGTAAFRIITPKSDWKLTGPSGSEISITEASPLDSIVETSSGVTKIDFAVNNNSKYVGQWKIDGASEDAELYVYSGLTIELDRDKVSQVIGQRENTLTGKILRTPNFAALPIDLSIYDKKDLTLEVLEDGERRPVQGVDVELLASGQLKIEKFKPEQESGDIELWVTLDIGGDFQKISSRFTLAAVAAKALAIAESDVVMLTTLEGPTGQATGVVTVNGPTVGDSSQFCIASSVIRTDDAQTAAEKKDRLANFVWMFDGVDASASDTCVDVANGETKVIQVVVSNSTQANAHVVSMRNMTSKAGAANYTAPIRFEFDTKTQGNAAVTIAVIFGLLALGILIPLLLLYLFNKVTTKFLPFENVHLAEYPIIVTPGFAPRILDARSGAAQKPITVGPQDFVAQVDQPASAEINTSVGVAKGRVPVFPLLATWYEAQALEGSRLLSMKSGGEKKPVEFADGKAAELSPNMSENWLLSFTESDLKGSVEDPLQGRLLVYSAMGTLPGYQTRVNDIVQTPGIAERITELREASKITGKKTKSKKPGKQSKANNESLTPIVTPTSSGPISGKLSAPGFEVPSNPVIPNSSGSNLEAPTSPLSPPSLPSSGKLAPPPPPGA